MPVVIKGLHIPTGKKLKKVDKPSKKKLKIETMWEEAEQREREDQRLVLWLGVFLGTMVSRLLVPQITVINLEAEK